MIKIWLEVSEKEQRRRFEARIDDPLRQWKLSPMDLHRVALVRLLAGVRHDAEGHGYDNAPWYILRSNDKRRARLSRIAHLLKLIPCKKLPRDRVKLPERSMKGAYDDQASLKGRTFGAEWH